METNQPMALRLLKLLTENKSLRTGYNDALLEIDSLHERLESSKKANDAWAAKTHALEAKNLGLLHALTAEQDENHALHQQLAAVGAGGVEPLRKRECLHQIDEQAQIYSDAQRDAERYRWLRDMNDWHSDPRIDDADGAKWQLTFYTPQRIEEQSDDDNYLDSAIDAARAAQGGV